MTITGVKGHVEDSGSLSQIDVEGEADADRVSVEIEVTGKTLSATSKVRQDGTWTARFKASESTSLTGFVCGALVAARATPSDADGIRTEWIGCIECDDPGDEDQSTDERSPRRSSRDSSDPVLVVEKDESGGQPSVTVRLASGDAETDGSEGNEGANASSDDSTPEASRESKTPEASGDDAADTSDSGDDGDAEDEQEDSSRWGRIALSLATAAFVVSLAAEGYPIMIAFTGTLLAVVSAAHAAKESARSWAVWTLVGVASGALLLAALLPFVGFVAMDVYLASAGLAIVGLASGAGVQFVRGSEG